MVETISLNLSDRECKLHASSQLISCDIQNVCYFLPDTKCNQDFQYFVINVIIILFLFFRLAIRYDCFKFYVKQKEVYDQL